MRKKIVVLVSLLLLLGLASSVPADITSNLTGHWKFDEGAGTLVTDYGSGGNNGVLKNWNGAMTGYWEPGPLGLAYNFNATDSSDTPTAAVSGLTNYTTVAYFKKHNPQPYDPTFAYKEEFMGGAMNLSAWTSWNPYVNGGNGGVYQSIIAGGGYSDQTGTVLSPSDLVGWHHYALVKDNVTATLTLYIDGIQRAQGTSMNSPYSAPSKFDIGSSIWGGVSLDGALDDFRIYDRALSANDVGELAAMIPEPTTIALLALGGLALRRRKR
jgi:hypothetical protein